MYPEVWVVYVKPRQLKYKQKYPFRLSNNFLYNAGKGRVGNNLLLRFNACSISELKPARKSANMERKEIFVHKEKLTS